MARAICRQYVDEHDQLHCLMLEAGLEELIAGHVLGKIVLEVIG